MAITSEFNAAVNQIATERGIPVEVILESIEMALVSAYRKDFGEGLAEDVEVTAKVDFATGEAQILKEGKDVTPAGFGRIAAQTAKQVILQKIRETEKDAIIEEYSEMVGTIVTGVIFRMEHDLVVLDLGKAHGVLLPSEQVPSDEYRTGQRLKVLIKEVKDSGRGPEVLVSRADPEFISKLFEQEVPEILSGVVRIEAISREPGSRTKMAVSSSDDRVDPVGSCVGQKGVRVQSVIAEIHGEKVDIVPFSDNEAKFIAAALSPAKVTDVVLNREEKTAVVTVPEDQQSLAIGKDGQNARLANKLTKWRIDIKGVVGAFGDDSEDEEGSSLDGESTSIGPKGASGIWDDVIKKVRAEEAQKKVDDEEAVEDEVSEEDGEAEAREVPEETPEEETLPDAEVPLVPSEE
ncbi:MAG TPA: transcription termination/antitermination protein NusA [candidate division WWE3 bacterium]|uniref:Transcription termination/antitermination protein NusA n=1 Tax=candidate division WWE3 bacterium TaxID=2053526 RepID=A0A7C1HTJ1_UNCKA|nr:transcription termination/antitermination protein NusA [candidate division WWE3 bacterium]